MLGHGSTDMPKQSWPRYGDIDIEKTSLFSRAEAAIATVKSCSTLRGGRTPPVRYLLHFCPVNEKRPRSLNPEAFEHRHR